MRDAGTLTAAGLSAGRTGASAQPPTHSISAPKAIAAHRPGIPWRVKCFCVLVCTPAPMGLILLEALAALLILLFIVWWTMFSGRRLHTQDDTEPPADSRDDASGGAGDRPQP